MMGIYQIINLVNHRKYIGSSTNIIKRWEEHINNLRYKSHHSYKLQNDWNTYNYTDFAFQILEIVIDKNKLLLREQEYIDGENIEELYNVMSHTNYKSISIPKELMDNVNYCDNIPDDISYKIKNNLTIIEKTGKLTTIGNNMYDLSKTWFNKHSNDVKQLRNNLNNYFNNLTTAKSNNSAWTTFTQYLKPLTVKGIGKSFIPINGEIISKNKRNYLCFAANCFPNSFTKRQHGIEIDDDKYALSIMLNWIVNVAEINEPMTIYIPSKRMENILREWLNM